MSKKQILNMTEEVRSGLEEQLSKTERDIAIVTWFNQGRDLAAPATVSCGIAVKNTKTGEYVDSIKSQEGQTTFSGQTGPLAEEPDSTALAIECDLASLATKAMQYTRGTDCSVEAAAQITRKGRMGGQLITVAAYIDEQGNLAVRTQKQELR